MIVSANIAAEFKPVTAIVDPSIIQDKVAVANYTTGQILVDGMFADPIENQITFAGRVPNDCALPNTVGSTSGKPVPCVGITISVDQTRGVAGVIVPGDFVNILVSPTRVTPKPTTRAYHHRRPEGRHLRSPTLRSARARPSTPERRLQPGPLPLPGGQGAVRRQDRGAAAR